MPQSALDNVKVDYCLPLAEIGPVLIRLVQNPIAENPDPVSSELAKEAAIAELDPAMLDNEPPGIPAGFACPDCGGSLWELREGDLIRFRCRVGHAWSVESLQAEQSEALEQALWTAFRALQERQALTRRMANKARNRGLDRAAASFEQQAEEAVRHAALLRHVLLNLSTQSPEEPIAKDREVVAPRQKRGH